MGQIGAFSIPEPEGVDEAPLRTVDPDRRLAVQSKLLPAYPKCFRIEIASR